MNTSESPQQGLRDKLKSIIELHNSDMSADPEEIDDYIALIADHDRQLLQTIASRLPEKLDASRLTHDEFMESKTGVLVRAQNSVIDQITTILDEIKGEL
jgi:hypothetical protein